MSNYETGTGIRHRAVQKGEELEWHSEQNLRLIFWMMDTSGESMGRRWLRAAQIQGEVCLQQHFHKFEVYN